MESKSSTTKTKTDSTMVHKGRNLSKFSINVTPHLRALNSKTNNGVIEVQYLRALITYFDRLQPGSLNVMPKSMNKKIIFSHLRDNYRDLYDAYFSAQDFHANLIQLRYACECGNQGNDCRIKTYIKDIIDKRLEIDQRMEIDQTFLMDVDQFFSF